MATFLPSCLADISQLPQLAQLAQRLPTADDLSSFVRLPTVRWPSFRAPNMLSIASLFDDEQRFLNRVWIILLGLEALLVLIGAVSAIVQGVVAMRLRRRRRRRQQQQTTTTTTTTTTQMEYYAAYHEKMMEAVWPPRSPRSPGSPGIVWQDAPRSPRSPAAWQDVPRSPRTPKSPGMARKRVTIVLPATVVDDGHRPMTPTNRTMTGSPDFGPWLFDSPAAKV